MRVRVPDRLRAALGKREIVKSFGGVSTRVAYRQGWHERAEIERLFELAEVQLGLSKANTPPKAPVREGMSEDQLLAVAKQFLHELEANAPPVPLDEDAQRDLREVFIEEAYNLGQPRAAEDATVQHIADRFFERSGLALPTGQTGVAAYEAIRNALHEHVERQLERHNGATVATINPAFAGIDAANGADEAGLTLSVAVNMYIEAPARSGNQESSKKMDRARLGALRDILGAQRAVISIGKADMREYLDQLIKLPAHSTQRFPGLTPAEAIVAGAAAGAPTLSPTSIKRDIQAVRSLFTWLEKQDFIVKNPAIHLEGPRAPKKSERRPFSPDEMRSLLNATNDPGDWTYWSARIAMLQGFRFIPVV